MLSTAAGDVELEIPKLRQGSFFPSLLERRRRIDRALFAVVMEAYVPGVFLDHRSSDDRPMDTLTRTYRFTITVNVEPGHPAYDDPEWAADAAWGALVNEYGLRAIYTGIVEVGPALVL